MPSTGFDRTSRVVALLLLLVSVWTSAHRQQDDDACLPMVEGEHDASQHAFAPLAPSDDEHCAVCHWARGLKPAFADTSISSTVLNASNGVSAPALQAPVAPIQGRLPARAPPALFL